MNNESGRSMVEMLGVLAIIGVLSVGGIAGYSTAMRRYQANEIINAVSRCGVMAQEKLAINGSTQADCKEFKLNGIEPVHEEGKTIVTMDVDDDIICETINSIGTHIKCDTDDNGHYAYYEWS